MKRLFNQIFRLLRPSYFKRWSKTISLWLAPGLIAAWPGQLNPSASQTFLLIMALLVIFLFLAVAVILPLALRASRKKQKKIPQVSPPKQSEIDTEPAMPALQLEDVTATQPSLRSISAEREPETLPASGQRPANIGWQIAGLTDTGLRRELNEDNLVMLETDLPCGLYVVADGMGGHDAGEVASKLTVETIQQYFTDTPPNPADSLAEWLRDAAMAANQVVLAQQVGRDKEHKMGSTLVMALVTEGEAHIANVGDSRAYRLNRAGIEQISIDHSLVERLVQIGQLTREEARNHRQKNVIYNTVGDKPDMEVSLYKIDLQPGDRLLLCSDGLSGMITDEEILEINQRESEPAATCRKMVEAAKRAGGHDNITAIVVQIDENDELQEN
jgi:protein phosphatase